MISLRERFEEKILFVPFHACWEWGGRIGSTGYGSFSINSRPKLAHRVSHELYKGPIPKGLQIDHLCRNPKCVRPDHLEAVTSRENTLRSTGLAAINAKKTHCFMGHPLSGTNLSTIKVGNGYQRLCKACAARRTREYRRRK